MDELRAKMRQVIQVGIDGWIDACFSGDSAPLDPVTGYPLVRDMAAVFYRSQKPYQAIEDEFIDGITGAIKPNSKFFQAWANYHWNYARIELGEVFEPVNLEMTEDVLERRQQLRDEMIGRGYRLVSNNGL